MPIYLVNGPDDKYSVDLIWGNEGVDTINSAFGCHWHLFPGAELERMPGTKFRAVDVHIRDVDAAFIRNMTLKDLVNDAVNQPPGNGKKAAEHNGSITDLAGPTIEKLKKIIRDFPEQYPHYATNCPKLNCDVKPWMVNKYGVTDREKAVFGAIIREHFKLLDDTQGLTP
jgi:hypothetical protein